MGEKNNTICSYLSKPEVFADFINGSLYRGKQVIAAKELESFAYTGKETHRDRSGNRKRRLRSRDVVKLRIGQNQYAVIAIENQDELHYFMPFRCMEYDAEDYAKQVRRLKKFHKEKKDLTTAAEFLSGVKKTDKLKPVVTLVFYHGKGTWDTCRELHDMLDFSGENEILKEYTSNYRANIIPLQELDENNFRTGLRELIGVMRRRDDEKKMRQFYQENEERFASIDEDTYDAISVMADRKNLRQYKEENRNEEGKVNMCRAFDQWEKEWFSEGEQAGLQSGLESGIALGEQKMALLIGKLLADGRLEDLRAASQNEKRRLVLYKEYGLTEAAAV